MRLTSNFALGEYNHALRLTSELVLTRRRIVAPYRLDKLGSGRSLLWAFRREKQSFRLFFSCHFGRGMRTQFQGCALEQFRCEDAINKEPTTRAGSLFMAPATGICSVLRASHREERSNVSPLIPLRFTCGGEFILLRVPIKKHAIKRAWHPVASNFAIGEYTHALRLTSQLVELRLGYANPIRALSSVRT